MLGWSLRANWASTMPWIWPNSFRTRPNITINITAISGSTASTARASRQFSQSSSALAPIIRKIAEIKEATAWAMNALLNAFSLSVEVS